MHPFFQSLSELFNDDKIPLRFQQYLSIHFLLQTQKSKTICSIISAPTKLLSDDLDLSFVGGTCQWSFVEEEDV